MKVFARRRRYEKDSTSSLTPWKKGDVEEVKAIEYRTCCPDMARAWDQGFIGFGEAEGMLNTVEAVCIYHCSPFPEGAVWDEMPISRCPFCGEAIDLEFRG